MSDLQRVYEEAQARQLPVLIEEWRAEPGPRGWIARALRIDLALLTARPELALPCVYRRCAWLGSERDKALDRTRATTLEGAAETRALLAEDAIGRGVPWLRALRSPEIALDGGVIEEYRTSERGDVAFSPDGGTIGIAGVIAWDRATGRAADPRMLVAPRVTPWRMPYPREPISGGFVILDGAERIAITGGEEDVRSIHALDDALAIAVADDPNDDYLGTRTCLVDVGVRRLRWVVEGGRCEYPIRRGDQLVHAEYGRLVIRELANGSVVARWYAPHVTSIAVAGEAIATRSGSVIRVWDAREAAARELQPHTASTVTLWSPDGDRVFISGFLCDGREGDVIRRLEVMDGGGWLEGGPPSGYHHLGTRSLAELVFELKVWDSRTGKSILTRRKLSARIGQTLRFDTRHRYLAIVGDRERGVRVYSLQPFAPIFERPDETIARVDGVLRLGLSSVDDRMWWENGAGERYVVDLAGDRQPRPSDEDVPGEPPRVAAEIADGLVTLRGALLPIDDDHATISPDGSGVAGPTTHCRVADLVP